MVSEPRFKVYTCGTQRWPTPEVSARSSRAGSSPDVLRSIVARTNRLISAVPNRSDSRASEFAQTMERSCVRCHGSSSIKGGLDMSVRRAAAAIESSSGWSAYLSVENDHDEFARVCVSKVARPGAKKEQILGREAEARAESKGAGGTCQRATAHARREKSCDMNSVSLRSEAEERAGRRGPSMTKSVDPDHAVTTRPCE